MLHFGTKISAIVSRFAASQRGINQTASVAHENKAVAQNAFTTGEWRVGKVHRCDAAANIVVVRSPGYAEMVCNMVVGGASYYFGAAETALPPEGAQVLVYMAHQRNAMGIIVGVIPGMDITGAVDEARELPAEEARNQWELEGAASGSTEEVWRNPLEDPNRAESANAGDGRPVDAMPGNRVIMNEQGVGVAVLNFIAALQASAKSSISVSVVDDRTEIHSGHYRHISSIGDHQIFNDGLLTTEEHQAVLYQFERSGYDNLGPPVLKAGDTEVMATNETSAYDLVLPDICQKKRMQTYHGHLGDMLALFVGRPDPALQPEYYAADNLDRGLNRTFIDSGGRLIIQSAAGISLQRWDRLPIPKRQKQPWDPTGDKPEDGGWPKDKPHVEWVYAHQYARHLQIRDGMAWRHRQAIKRLHDQSKGNGGVDFYLPDEEDLPTPEDLYDPEGQATEEYQKNHHRQTYFNMEDDGSFIIRDAWGAEIHMRGGNIIFNAPGNIEARSGKTTTILAGHDAVIKGRKSVDVTATDRDVRIKANVNLELVSEGRGDPHGAVGTTGGGILLESKSLNDSAYFAKGENDRSRGIILKATDSRVFVEAKKVHLAARRDLMFETFEEDDTTDAGRLIISTGRLYANAKHMALIGVGTESGLVLLKTQALLAGPLTALVAETSAAIVENQKAWWPLAKPDIATDPYADMQGTFEELYERIQDDTDWLRPYSPAERADIKFTYRSAQEYGTLAATEVEGATVFYEYESSWAYLKRVGHFLLRDGSTEFWVEDPIDDTWAWPGEENYTGTCYVRLEKEVNIKEPDIGIAKRRRARSAAVGPLESPVSFNEYEVWEH